MSNAKDFSGVRICPVNLSSEMAFEKLFGYLPGQRSCPRSSTQTLCRGAARAIRDAAMPPPYPLPITTTSYDGLMRVVDLLNVGTSLLRAHWDLPSDPKDQAYSQINRTHRKKS